MVQYTHILIASFLESVIKPENLGEYYWEAIAPDVRYLASMRRAQTHLSSKVILDDMNRYPQLNSFLQGYLVHCLTDEVKLKDIVFRNFPLVLFKNKISYQQMMMIFEFYNLEEHKTAVQITGKHNEMLTDLGLREAHSLKYLLSVNSYLSADYSEPMLKDLLALMGLEKDSRLEKYMAAAESFQKNQLLKKFFFSHFRKNQTNEKIVRMVKSSLPEKMWG